jgi:hypothetical protein
MRVIQARNVNDAFYEGIQLITEAGAPEETRNGPVLVAPYPVMTCTTKPMERVLFQPLRDANPFFHLMESLWMLAGHDDAAFLNFYIKDFGKRFAERNGIIHGAYGHRWRDAFGCDQLEVIINRLKEDPSSRQCVLQMWDCSVEDDLEGSWKDRPCNTHAYFRVRENELDLTVCCRSNDLIWGAHGANAVHFSVLLEYMAGRIGLDVGMMYQLSNNYHAYEEQLIKVPLDKLKREDGYRGLVPCPMATDWEGWDADLRKFMVWHYDDKFSGNVELLKALKNQWFHDVAGYMVKAMNQWKNGFRQAARDTVENIQALDWRLACIEWMDRRLK